MTKVFISHTASDNDETFNVATFLRSKDVIVWLDEADVGLGVDIPASVNEALTTCDVFLLLYSSGASVSKWVAKEWSSAVMRSLESGQENFRIIVGCLDETPLPPVLGGMRSVNLHSDQKHGLEQLAASLGVEDSDRPSVWYFDDEKSRLDDFERRHGDAFSVTKFQDAPQLLSGLMSAVRPNQLPDILLLDFHAPRPDVPPVRVEEAKAAVARLVRAERELRGHVDRAWHPTGVDIVETVREFYPPDQLPIAMHTQQGLALLRDDLIQQLEYHSVGWLIKNRFSAETDRMVLASIARRSGHTTTRVRPRALIIDDNPGYIKMFIERQRGHYDIEAISSEDVVMSTLSRMESRNELPDIFLVDMYYPTEDEDLGLIDIANTKLREFAQLENETQKLMSEAFSPIGLSILRQVRRIIPASKLPMAMYTTSGLVTIGDRDFREVQRLECGWLLKDRYDERTEEVMILGEMMN